MLGLVGSGARARGPAAGWRRALWKERGVLGTRSSAFCPRCTVKETEAQVHSASRELNQNSRV